MYCQVEICCLCLNTSMEKFQHLNSIKALSAATYYEKLNSTLSKLVFANKSDDYMLCSKCCSTIDSFYEFSLSCIRNLEIFSHYRKLLSSPINKQGELVKLSDFSDTLNNIEFIKLEDPRTCEVTDVRLDNTIPKQEILQPEDAYKREHTREINNDVKFENDKDNSEIVAEENWSDNIDIKVEELDIKIEQPDVITNYMKHAYGQPLDVTDSNHVLTATASQPKPIDPRKNSSADDLSNKGCSNDSSNHSKRRQTNTDKKIYRCKFCDKKFNSYHQQKKHKILHTNKMPFVCGVCYKGFIVKSAFVSHKRTHTGEKPYVCEVCNKRFTVNGELVRHKRIHTGEKPHICEVCNKGFIIKSALVTHKRIHTGEKPYVCNVCNRGFTVNDHLVKHYRIHTGEKPFVCEVCNKGFHESSNLKKHKFLHTSERPYVCEVCNKGYIQNSSLVKHMRIHTK